MDEKLGQLERVELKDVWPTEDRHFTPWLADNIALLGEALQLDLEVEEVEQYIGRFKADIVCRDLNDDQFVLIENQFGKTDHKHLGQTMTYSAGIDAGIVVWIAEEFSEEHRAVLDWLNSRTSPDLSFFGVKISLVRIGDSDPAPIFDPIALPNDWSRSARRNAESGTGEMSDGRRAFRAFWDQFRERWPQDILGRKQPQLVNDPEVFNFASSPSFTELRGILRGDQGRSFLRIQFRFRGDKGRVLFETLYKEKSAIENELGTALEWHENPGSLRTRFYVELEIQELADETLWPASFDWVESVVRKMQTVIQPRIDAFVQNQRVT